MLTPLSTQLDGNTNVAFSFLHWESANCLLQGVIIAAGDFRQANLKVLPDFYQHLDFATRGTSGGGSQTLQYARWNTKSSLWDMCRQQCDVNVSIQIPTDQN